MLIHSALVVDYSVLATTSERVRFNMMGPGFIFVVLLSAAFAQNGVLDLVESPFGKDIIHVILSQICEGSVYTFLS